MSNRTRKRRKYRDEHKKRAMTVRLKREQLFAKFRNNLTNREILYVSVDIGKNIHYWRADTSDTAVIIPSRLRTNQTGYQTFRQQLRQLLESGQYKLVVLGHEPTGIYHETWSRAILDEFAEFMAESACPRLLYRFMNPYQVKLERTRLTLRHSKTDPIDLRAISSLLQQGQGNPAYMPQPKTTMLCQQVYLARQTAKRLKQVERVLMNQIDMIWPGALVNIKRFRQAHPDLDPPEPLVKTKPFERQRFRVIMEHCPNPYQVMALGETGLRALFHQQNQRCGPKTAAHIVACAKQAMLNPPEVVEVYCQALSDLWQDETRWRTHLETIEEQWDSLIDQTPAQHLVAIPGMSATLAARYLALVGGPPRFEWADQLWKYVGFDAIVSDSGDRRKTYSISRQGEAHHRNLLSWMACCVAGHHPTFGLHFIKAEQRGKGIWGAAIHTAHKLNRLCFRLIVDDRPYQERLNPDDVQRWRAYWLAYRKHQKSPQKHPHPGNWRATG